MQASAQARQTWWIDLLRIAVLALGYFALAKLGLTFATVKGNVTLFWPPGGLAIVFLMIFGLRYWPGITLGAILATASTKAPWAFVAATAVGNTLFPLAAAWMLQRNQRFSRSLAGVYDAALLTLAGALVAPLISAGCGTLGLLAAGMILPEAAWGSVLTWWLGDGMGVLLVAPVILAWASPSRAMPWPRKLDHAILLLLLTAILLVIVFGTWFPVFNEYFSLAFLLVPVIVWAAVSYGLRGATALTTLIALVAGWSTAQGYGALALLPKSLDIELSWLFVVACAATALFSGSAVEEFMANLVEQQRLVGKLEHALSEVHTLKGLLPICARCKKIRDDHGYWQHVESYISRHTTAQFTHSLCPSCASLLYPGLLDDDETPSQPAQPEQ